MSLEECPKCGVDYCSFCDSGDSCIECGDEFCRDCGINDCEYCGMGTCDGCKEAHDKDCSAEDEEDEEDGDDGAWE